MRLGGCFVKCERCKMPSSQTRDTPELAVRAAVADGWVKVGDSVYCPACADKIATGPDECLTRS